MYRPFSVGSLHGLAGAASVVFDCLVGAASVVFDTFTFLDFGRLAIGFAFDWFVSLTVDFAILLLR